MKILVVEDERITAEDIRFRLEDMGHTVTAIASSGEESIQKVAETKPDFVLMDIVETRKEVAVVSGTLNSKLG